MGITPPMVVDGPNRQPLPYGLFSVLNFRPDVGHWYNGVLIDAATCEDVEAFGMANCDPDAEPIEGLPRTTPQDPAPFDDNSSSFTVYGWDNCPSLGVSEQRSVERAQAHLLGREQAKVEHILWTGELGNYPNFSGLNGMDVPNALGNWEKAVDALAAVEQGIAERYGSLGIIHMSRFTALLVAGSLEFSGSKVTTKLGTPVVAGGGYPNEGKIVGTPAMFGYRGEVNVTDPGPVYELRKNDRLILAERSYLIGMDPCALVTATHTTPTTVPIP